MKKRVHMLAKAALCGLMLLGFGCSSFKLTSVPEADIYEHGRKIGSTPYSFSLISGKRNFTLRRLGYVDKEVVVSSLDKQIQHYRMEWIGLTRVDTLPPGATITDAITEEKLGTSPSGLRLAVQKNVRIEKEGFEPVEMEITPNETYVIELKPLGGFKSSFYRQITFTSKQDPVDIYDRVAGVRIGTTPVQLNIEAGSELEYRKAGYRPQTTMISKSAPSLINIELDPASIVTLRGPAGAGVYRAGGREKIGELPYQIELKNDMLFEIRKEGYYKSTVALAPGAAPELDVELKKIPYKTIVSVPEGADVYRLGGMEKLGVTPYTVVVDSERVFEIKKGGYATSVVGLGPSSPEQFEIPLNTSGRDDPDAAAISTLDSPAVKTY